jgi:cob(I)alamin adenosyltransferase
MLIADCLCETFMKIYTKTGDKGVTGLLGGKRIPKDADRIEAYGTVDELNAVIGVVRSFRLPKAVEEILVKVQRDLFVVGAELASPDEKLSQVDRITFEQVTSLEKNIDKFDTKLPKLSSFILPEGTSAAAHLHFARTVCRRAERRVVHLFRQKDDGQAKSEVGGGHLIIYLNRLSDLLFVLARFTNYFSKQNEETWRGNVRKKTKKP